MITIRSLGPDDLQAVRELFLYFQEDSYTPGASLPTDDYLRQLLQKSDFHVLAAFEDDQLLGGLTAYELPMYTRAATELFLFEIGVMEAFQRRGIATALIHALQSQAAADGRDVIFVATERSNTAAMGLYAATGAAAEPDSILFTYAVANEAE